MTDLIPRAAVEAAVLRALDNSDPEACEWVLKAIRSIPPAQEGEGLPSPLKIGGVTFGKGVSMETVRLAIERLNDRWDFAASEYPDLLQKTVQRASADRADIKVEGKP